jgi:hypothetical protein
MNSVRRIIRSPFWIKLFHWEYWSFNTIYIPIYIVWLALCLRARSFFFFAASNPLIKNGGFLNESKKDIAPMVPENLHPRTLFFIELSGNGPNVLATLLANGFRFPLIGKPDIGGRGRGVRILRMETDVVQYAEEACFNFHIQEFIPYEKEVGVFYYRYPGQEKGAISGIVRKEFLAVKGDGLHTVKQLLELETRAILQIATLDLTQSDLLAQIPTDGEERIIVPYGNHARGARFLDDSHLIDDEISARIDQICHRIPEFYFGRLDIRYRTWEELKRGEHFSIIEVNGAGSEPTHIYDPRHTLFFGWKEIIRHWIILFRVSKLNHRKGYPYLSIKEGIAMFREDKVHSARLARMS